MSLQTLDHSPQAILRRLDIVLNELLTLRQAVQKLAKAETKSVDMVSKLAGSLGPAAPDELDYFNTLDVTWQRFDDEQDNR